MKTLQNIHDEGNSFVLLAARRRVVRIARAVARRHCGSFYAKPHQVLNTVVGVEGIEDCSLEQLQRQAELAEEWLETGIEP